jgi:hypothetical protein
MSSSKRDRLMQEIFETVPVVQMFAAAGLMWWRQRTDLPPGAVLSPTVEEIAQFVEGLDLRGARELRRIALAMEGGTVH